MSGNPTYISALKRLARTKGDIVDAITLPDYLQKAEDRPAAIIETARLEDALQNLIESKMVPLTNPETDEMFNSDRLLGSLSAKIQMSYALGLIGPHSRRDFTTIRLIRNALAHSRKAIFFQTKEISNACDQLSLLERYTDHQTWNGINPPFDTARKRFMATISLSWIAIFEVVRPEFNDETHPLLHVPLD